MTFKSIGLVVALTLATIAGLNSNAYAFNIDEGVEGFYYEPGVTPDPRRGWGFQYLPTGPEQGVLFVAGYVYDIEGNATWVVGNEVVSDGDFQVDIPLIALTGGSFGPGAGSPVQTDWGSVNLVFHSCSRVDLTFSGGTDFTQEFSPFLQIVGGVKADRCVYQSEFTACPPGTEDLGQRRCMLIGSYNEDLRLTNDTTWVLDGVVYVGSPQQLGAPVPEAGPVLEIEAGTRIEGRGENSALVISRGAKILAEGQPHAPIILTSEGSSYLPEQAVSGAWGGLLIHGAAQINGCASPPCEHEGEGDTGAYGGSNDDDDSGVLRYVRIQYPGGAVNAMGDEIPGLGLEGVGRGTVIDHVQIHRSADDALKFHGGTVNLKHLVVTDGDEDAIDWSDGYRGKIQHAVIWQRDVEPDWGDRGIEGENADGDHDYDGNNATPRSMPTLANFTMVGNFGQEAINIRAGSGGRFSNFVIVGFQHGINIDDQATFTNAGTPQDLTGVLTFENVISWTNNDWVLDDDGLAPWDIVEFMQAQRGNTRSLATGLYDAQGYTYILSPGTVAWYLRDHDLDSDPERFDDFFDDTGYAGAFRSTYSAWHHGWTEFLP